MLESLKTRRKRLLRELAFIEEEIKKEEDFIQKHTKKIRCPKCGGDSWKVYATYDPFKKIAYEGRILKFICTNCLFEWVEQIETETN